MSKTFIGEKDFFNYFKELDMDSSFEVQKLAINFRKWAEWNKATAIIDILESYELNTIVVVHNLFDEVKICDSWEFLNDIVAILKDYADYYYDERWEDMTEFWTKKII